MPDISTYPSGRETLFSKMNFSIWYKFCKIRYSMQHPFLKLDSGITLCNSELALILLFNLHHPYRNQQCCIQTFFLLQCPSYCMLLSPHHCFIAVFSWFLCSLRYCTDELENLHVTWTNYLWENQTEPRARIVAIENRFKPPQKIFYWLLKPCFCCGLLLSLFVFACMYCWYLFNLDSHLAILWESNLVNVLLAFRLRRFNVVLLSLKCLGWEM